MPYPFSYGLLRRRNRTEPQVGHPDRGRRAGVKAARRAGRTHRR